MKAIEVIRETESSEEFRAWKKANPKAYLTSAFSMFADGDDREWLISYYSSEKDSITTFSGDGLREEEAFKKEGDIPELRLDDVKADEDASLKAAKSVLSENYGGNPQKAIIVLQNLDGEALWNITLITEGFKLVNVRVSAATGKAISHKASSLSDFMKKE